MPDAAPLVYDRAGPGMYTAHFGLAEPPFSITPDPRYLYMSERHREALAHLVYGTGQSGGFVQLTGEVGTGKTTLSRCVLEQLPPHVDVALILNPRLTSAELLATVCDELKVPCPPGASIKTLVDALYRYLLEAHERGRTTVLIIDEAQRLAPSVIEEVRLLTNLETSTHKLLQVVLVGQPELARLLERPDLRQVAQRITARYHLTPLRLDETRAYVRHRLGVAGGSERLFTQGAIREIHRLSGGVPRLINVICDRALLGAYAADRREVGGRTARRAGAEVLRGRSRPGGTAARIAQVAAGVVAGVGIAAAVAIVVSGGGPVLALLEPAAGRAPLPAASARPAAAIAAPASGPAEPLADLLRDAALDRGAALGALYRRWRPAARPDGPLTCDGGRVGELGCLARAGTWTTLRRLDRPAVLELTLPGRETRFAALVRLGPDAATLDLGPREVTVPLRELERYWDGEFLLLWQLPPRGARAVQPGSRGEDVEWLRRRLGAIDGTAPAAGAVFDDELRARVMAFQRSRGLAPDGVAGVETLVQLSAALDEPGVPRLVAGP